MAPLGFEPRPRSNLELIRDISPLRCRYAIGPFYLICICSSVNSYLYKSYHSWTTLSSVALGFIWQWDTVSKVMLQVIVLVLILSAEIIGCWNDSAGASWDAMIPNRTHPYANNINNKNFFIHLFSIPRTVGIIIRHTSRKNKAKQRKKYGWRCGFIHHHGLY